MKRMSDGEFKKEVLDMLYKMKHEPRSGIEYAVIEEICRGIELIELKERWLRNGE